MRKDLFKKRLYVKAWLFLATLTLVLLIPQESYAVKRYLNYLPRNEEIVTVATPAGYSRVLNSVAGLETEFAEAAACRRCVNVLQANCPDCCFVDPLSAGHRLIRCTEDEEEIYDVDPASLTSYPFEEASCSRLDRTECHEGLTFPDDGSDCTSPFPGPLPGCFQYGCPFQDADKAPDDEDNCEEDSSSGDWYCNTNSGPLPVFRGCPPVAGVTIPDQVLITSTATSDFYDLTYFEHCPIEITAPTPPPANIDVSGNGVVNNGDVMQVTNDINDGEPNDPVNDVNGDGSVTPLDVLEIINWINAHTGNELCYKYEVSSRFNDYIDACIDVAEERELKNKTIHCCAKDHDVCSASGTSGFDNNCLLFDPATPYDGVNCIVEGGCGGCAERKENVECDEMTAATCQSLSDDAVEHLLEASGSGSYFREIDTAQRYSFVAKSREGIVVLWQLNCTDTSTTPGGVPVNVGSLTYFFTRIQVVDEDDGTVVHESFATQRSFEAQFTVFGGTLIPTRDSNDDPILEQGKRYSVRIMYFMPDLVELHNYDPTVPAIVLHATITDMRLIVFRTRE
jgi:hypothetical protein